jgi:hypothetical protein
VDERTPDLAADALVVTDDDEEVRTVVGHAPLGPRRGAARGEHEQDEEDDDATQVGG